MYSLRCFSVSFFLIDFHFLGVYNNQECLEQQIIVPSRQNYYKACRVLQYQPVQTQKLSPLKLPFKIFKFIFYQTASHSQPACLCHRTLHYLNSRNIRHLHHNLGRFLSTWSFLQTHETLCVWCLFRDAL